MPVDRLPIVEVNRLNSRLHQADMLEGRGENIINATAETKAEWDLIFPAQISNNDVDYNLLANWNFVRGMVYLRTLAHSSTSLVPDPLSCLVTAYIACLKSGTVSPLYLTKITSGVLDDLGRNIVLQSGPIKSTYQMCGKYINETNAEPIFNRWLELMPAEANRLILSIGQAAGHGLTAFTTIGRALRKYPSFYWQKMSELFAGEFTKFWAAVRLVNGNRYYGFRKGDNSCAAVQFLNLAYASSQLLIQVGGESDLKHAAVFNKQFTGRAMIDHMIKLFINDRIIRAEDLETPISEVFAGQMASLESIRNSDLFI